MNTQLGVPGMRAGCGQAARALTAEHPGMTVLKRFPAAGQTAVSPC